MAKFKKFSNVVTPAAADGTSTGKIFFFLTNKVSLCYDIYDELIL